MATSPTPARRSLTIGGVLAVGAACAAVLMGWQVRSDDDRKPEPAPIVSTVDQEADPDWTSIGAQVEMLDLGALHASSRLQYDECQMNYADVASEPSSNGHSFYFC